MSENGVVLSARDLRRDYAMGAETVHAVRGVSIDIARGEYVAIVGPSGCGKSTLLNLLGAIDPPSSGSLSILGRRLEQLSDRDATRFRLEYVGFVFQRFYLMPVLTALENIELPMAEAGVEREARRERARELLRYVGLGARAPPSATALGGRAAARSDRAGARQSAGAVARRRADG
jgi:putative ABC transport system ATP-binding protein